MLIKILKMKKIIDLKNKKVLVVAYIFIKKFSYLTRIISISIFNDEMRYTWFSIINRSIIWNIITKE